MERHNIGIEIGTSKYSMGIFDYDKINLIQNSLGEEVEPSLISIKKNNILVGDSAFLDESSNYSNTINEIKRLIAYNYIYDNNIFEEYKKYLSYNIERSNNNDLVVNIDDKTYSIEEILSFIFRQLIIRGENNDIFAPKKYILSVPPCFGLLERQLIRKAAKLAEIDDSKFGMISETSAAAIAYELNLKNNFDYDIYEHDPNQLDDQTPGPISLDEKNILVFDLGAGCFNLTIISINETNNQKLNFKVKANLGNPFFGGIDFDNKLVQYCIDKFCETCNIKEEDIFNNKKAIKILKLRCEMAKKILSKEEIVLVNIPNFIYNYNLCVRITRDIFNSICTEFYSEIKNKIMKILKIINMDSTNIEEVLVIGGNAKIPKIIEILNDIFGQIKVKKNIDCNKIVIVGTSIYSYEIQQKNPKFNLNEIIFSSFGINVSNPDSKLYIKHGDKMLKLIRKNSSFSYKSKFNFKYKISKNNKIYFNIYEGESKFVKYNRKLKSIKTNILSKFGENFDNQVIKFFIEFKLDNNYILEVKVCNKEIGLEEIYYIGQFDEKELKKNQGELITLEKNKELILKKKNLKEYASKYSKYKDDERDKVLKNCCECCEKILDIYQINYNSENIMIKIFQLTEELFSYYLERLKIKIKLINDDNEIILKIKERMKYLKDIDGYNEILLNKFKELFELNRNIYYPIILNYIELLVSQNASILKNIEEKNFYYFNEHFQKSKRIIGYNLKEMKVYHADEELLKKIEIIHNLNNIIKGLIPGSKNILEEFQKLENIKKNLNDLIQKDKKFSCLTDIFDIIKNIEDLKNN